MGAVSALDLAYLSIFVWVRGLLVARNSRFLTADAVRNDIVR